MTDKNIIEKSDVRAGGKVTFELEPDTPPTQLLAKLFAEAVYELVKQNPWPDAPPAEVALAWSLTEIIKQGASLVKDRKEFLADVIHMLDDSKKS